MLQSEVPTSADANPAALNLPIKDAEYPLAQPLFPAADGDVVITALEDLSSSLMQLAGPYQQQIDLASILAPRIRWLAARGDLTAAINLSVVALDACLLDEMRPETYSAGSVIRDYLWTDQAAQYFRFFSGLVWLPHAVAQQIAERHNTSLSSILILPAGCNLYLEWKRYPLTEDLVYLINPGQALMPLMAASRQQVIASLLRSGINYFAGWLVNNPKRAVRSEKAPYEIARYCRIAKRISQGGMSVPVLLERRHWQHWQRVFTESPQACSRLNLTDLLLVNSGSAANEAVITALSQMEQHYQVYLHPYWYFENKRSITTFFAGTQTRDPKQASVFFLNTDAVSHHDYQSAAGLPTPFELIQVAADNARLTGEPVVVVVDVTQQPDFCFGALLDDLPENLILIKTCSLTKWQQGSRNYFAGSIAIYNAAFIDLNQRIRQVVREISAELNEFQLLQLSRTSRQSMTRTRLSLRKKAEYFRDSLDVPEGWTVTLSGQLIFVVPSAAMLKEMNDLIMQLRGLLGDDKARAVVADTDTRIATVIARLTEQPAFSSIESGNSFGLAQTRVNYDIGVVEVGDQRVGVGGLRIAPGWNTPTQELDQFAASMIPAFVDALKQGLQALNEQIVKFNLLQRSKESEGWIGMRGAQKSRIAHSVQPVLDAFLARHQMDYTGPVIGFSRAQLRSQADKVGFIQRETGIRFVAAVKSGALNIYPDFAEHLAGFDLSNHREYEEIKAFATGKELFFTSPVALKTLPTTDASCVTVVVDELNQLEHYRQLTNVADQPIPSTVRFGLRLDSVALLEATGVDAAVCSNYPKSRFGYKPRDIPLAQVAQAHGVSGFHIHHGSENNQINTYLLLLSQLQQRLAADQESNWQPEFISLGGGVHHLSLSQFAYLARAFRKVFPDTQLYMEPGRFLTQNCGYAIAEVGAVKTEGDSTYITLDLSADCHLKWSDTTLLISPSAKQRVSNASGPYPHQVPEQSQDTNESHRTLVFGATCYEQDFVGDYQLPKEHQFALFDKVLLGNISSYSVQWNASFNGIAEIPWVMLEDQL